MSAKPKPLPVFSIEPAEGGFTLYRDQGPLQTPRTLLVTVPTRKLADALLGECRSQDEKLDLRKMPMMQMTLTAIDITASHRGEVIDGIMKYGDSELVCQRASDPPDLVSEQNKTWQSYLDWAQARFDATLLTGSGIIPFKQNPEALKALRVFVESFDAFRLTGVSEAVGISGSLILGLALVTRNADAETVFAAAELDHLWQAKKWGEDPAMENRRNEITRELNNCTRWLSLLDDKA